MAVTAFSMPADIPVVFLVCAGRDGGGFMQSLLDSHPQVLMLPMELKFHGMWDELGADGLKNPDDMANAWCAGTKLRKLGQGVRYGYGEGEDDHTPCDFEKFKRRFKELIGQLGLDRRRVFLALHQAYAESIGQDPAGVECIVEFSAYPDRLDEALSDFPEARALQMTRDPRGNFASYKGQFIRSFGVLVHPGADTLDEKLLLVHMLANLRTHLDTLHRLRGKLGPKRFLAVRLDDMHLDNENTMRRTADWLGINFSPCLLESTIGGKAWLGNSSTGKPVSGVDPSILTRWKRTLAPREVALVETLFSREMREFGWDRQEPQKPRATELARCLLPFPGEFSYTPVDRETGNKRLKALAAVHPSLVGLVRAARAWLKLVPLALLLYPYSRLRLMRMVSAAPDGKAGS